VAKFIVFVSKRTAAMAMFVTAINAEALFRVNVVDVAAAVIMSVFFTGVGATNESGGESTVAILVVTFY